MIEPSNKDKRREVIYRTAGQDDQRGVITSQNLMFVFVRFGDEEFSKACRREDLHWASDEAAVVEPVFETTVEMIVGEYLIWSEEHGAWWKPGKWGYTTSIREAGHYTEAEATEIVKNANIFSFNEMAICVAKDVPKVTHQEGTK